MTYRNLQSYYLRERSTGRWFQTLTKTSYQTVAKREEAHTVLGETLNMWETRYIKYFLGPLSNWEAVEQGKEDGHENQP